MRNLAILFVIFVGFAGLSMTVMINSGYHFFVWIWPLIASVLSVFAMMYASSKL